MPTSHSGQAVISIIITLLIGMTIALGIYLSSLSGTKVSTTHDDSERAFNAADAGIEEVIRRSSDKLSAMIPAESTEVKVGSLSSLVKVSSENSFSMTVAQNDAVTIPLFGGSATGVKISWTREGADCATWASLIIAKWKNDNTVTYYAVNPNICPHNPPAVGFSQSTPEGAIDTFSISGINPAIDLYLRIRPIYNKANIKVEATGGSLPTQQFSITSNVKVEGSNESRAIRVTKTMPDLPSIFDYVLFSGNAITK